MTCEELYGRLTELSEGSLQGEVCAEVERHLAACRGCQQIREDLEDLARLCRDASGPTTMPEDVRDRIATLLSAPADGPSPRSL